MQVPNYGNRMKNYSIGGQTYSDTPRPMASTLCSNPHLLVAILHFLSGRRKVHAFERFEHFRPREGTKNLSDFRRGVASRKVDDDGRSGSRTADRMFCAHRRTVEHA